MALGLAAWGASDQTAANFPEEEIGQTTEESSVTESMEETAESVSSLIGVAMPTKDLQRWNQDDENMKTQLENAGYIVDLQCAANDITTQVSQIENMIAGGCQALVIVTGSM